MKKILNFLPPLFMLGIIVVWFVLYDIGHIDTEPWILVGTSNIPFVFKATMIGLFLFTMLCIPTYCLMVQEEWIKSCLYCIVVLIGTILGKNGFMTVFVLVTCFIGFILGAITEIVLWIIRLFFKGVNGTWIIGIAQVIGHIVTSILLCAPSEYSIFDETSNSDNRSSYSSNSTRDFYQDEMRNIREKEKLETLRQIERDLRYK